MENDTKTEASHIRYAIPPGTMETLQNKFCYHAPQGDQVQRYAEIRAKLLHVAAFISERCPPSRELSLCLTHLEEAMYSANASIARNETPGAAQP